jgi:hypothetical protein
MIKCLRPVCWRGIGTHGYRFSRQIPLWELTEHLCDADRLCATRDCLLALSRQFPPNVGRGQAEPCLRAAPKEGPGAAAQTREKQCERWIGCGKHGRKRATTAALHWAAKYPLRSVGLRAFDRKRTACLGKRHPFDLTLYGRTFCNHAGSSHCRKGNGISRVVVRAVIRPG